MHGTVSQAELMAEGIPVYALNDPDLPLPAIPDGPLFYGDVITLESLQQFIEGPFSGNEATHYAAILQGAIDGKPDLYAEDLREELRTWRQSLEEPKRLLRQEAGTPSADDQFAALTSHPQIRSIRFFPMMTDNRPLLGQRGVVIVTTPIVAGEHLIAGGAYIKIDTGGIEYERVDRLTVSLIDSAHPESPRLNDAKWHPFLWMEYLWPHGYGSSVYEQLKNLQRVGNLQGYVETLLHHLTVDFSKIEPLPDHHIGAPITSWPRVSDVKIWVDRQNGHWHYTYS